MKRYTPAARVWIVAIIGAAGVATALAAQSGAVTSRAWFALAILGLSAAVAHFFPIRSANSEASYRLTSVFVIAGAVILPGILLTPLVALAITPAAWHDRRRTDRGLSWLINMSHTALAVYAAHMVITLDTAPNMETMTDLLLLVGAASIFIAVHNAIVAMGMALHFRTAVWRLDVLRAPALLTEGLFGMLGILTVGLWTATPLLLLLLVPLLLLAHGLTRNAHLAALAYVDPKTGLHNSRGFEQFVSEALRRSEHTAAPLAVLFIDLDHFKRVNDTYGHLAGDVVLQQFATILTATLRKDDVAARFGGEEFTVLLHNTDPDAAAAIADALRYTIERHRFCLDDGTAVACTISIGIATFPNDGSTPKALLGRADQALYQAKRTRNATRSLRAIAEITRLPPQHERHADGTIKGSAPPRRFRRPPATALVLWATILCGGATVGIGVFSVWRTNEWLLLMPFMGLAIVSEFFPVQLYKANREKMTVTLTDAVVMAMVTLQPLAAPLVNVAAGLVHVVTRRQRRLDKLLFNLTNPALAAGVGAGMYLLLRPVGAGFTLRHLIASFAGAVAFVVANSGVVALMISLHSKRPLLLVVRELLWYVPITILLGMTGAFLGAVSHELGIMGAAMFIVPVVLMRLTLGFSAKKNQEAIETLQAAKASLEKADEEKTKSLRQLIETVSNIIDARDNLVWGHSRTVADYAVQIGKELGLSEEQLSLVHSAGLLHDLGKVAIPERILHNPGRLTDEEFSIVREHPITGKRILAEVELLGEVAIMVGDHHERYDGNGYPHRKEGEEISIGGRILAVADTLDSILSDRPYSGAKPLSVALAEIDRCSGTQFDPTIVAALHRVVVAEGEKYFANSALDVATRRAEPMVPQVIAFPKMRVG